MAPAFPPVTIFVLQFALVSTVPLSRSPASSFRQVGISADLFIGQRNTSLGRIERVCVVDSVVYYEDEAVPTTNACEQCVCKPPGFACNTVRCPPPDADDRRCHKRPVRRADKCCPDYSCDCHKDGRIFHTGQKITDPSSPCQVCYCQHGRIFCSAIRCFSRNDCQPVQPATGRCCPSYDHCQPLVGQLLKPIRLSPAFLQRPASDQRPVADAESRRSAATASAEPDDSDTVTTESDVGEFTMFDERWALGDDQTTTHLANGRETVQPMEELTTAPMTDAPQPEANTETSDQATESPSDQQTWSADASEAVDQ